MIKAIITDVDGVMVGKTEGVNFPLPNPVVIDALRQISQSGVPIVLCTVKFGFAIEPIVRNGGLDNVHITNGGASIIDPLGEPKVVAQKIIESSTVCDYLAATAGAYIELFSVDEYYVQKDVDPVFMEKRSKVARRAPVLVDSLEEVALHKPIIKMITFADDEQHKSQLEATLGKFDATLDFIWSHHPYISPKVPCVATAPGVSKQTAAQEVMTRLGISFDAVLGIGDSPADWSFMQLCGAVATVGGSPELEGLAATKAQHYFGGSVDDNALLDIFQHFNLTH